MSHMAPILVTLIWNCWPFCVSQALCHQVQMRWRCYTTFHRCSSLEWILQWYSIQSLLQPTTACLSTPLGYSLHTQQNIECHRVSWNIPSKVKIIWFELKSKIISLINKLSQFFTTKKKFPIGLDKVVRGSMCVGRGGEGDTVDDWGGGWIMLQRQLFELGGNIALFLTKLLLICRATRKKKFHLI